MKGHLSDKVIYFPVPKGDSYTSFDCIWRNNYHSSKSACCPILFCDYLISVRVQMYAAVNRELCDRMMSELEAMLTTQLEMYDTVLQIEKYKDAPPDSHLPLLVLCINASRLGTDVNQALRDVNSKFMFNIRY